MKLPKKSDALIGEDKSLEDEDENFLNPEDLSIIDEKTWEPSDEEILSYALNQAMIQKKILMSFSKLLIIT